MVILILLLCVHGRYFELIIGGDQQGRVTRIIMNELYGPETRSRVGRLRRHVQRCVTWMCGTGKSNRSPVHHEGMARKIGLLCYISSQRAMLFSGPVARILPQS